MRPRIALIDYLVGTVLAAGVAGCVPITEASTTSTPMPNSDRRPVSVTATSSHIAENGIAFRTLVRGFRLGGALSQPTLLVAVNAAGHNAVSALIAPEHRTLLANVDFQREALLAVFSRTTPYGGHSITVNRVAIVDAEIVVDATLLENDPTLPKIEAATLPYHLVVMESGVLLQRRNWRYRLLSGDALLAASELSLR
ncbi:MAG: hypothetical protein RMN25_02585 [Anaerolineae bacterium]|nr:hypothetical protein [Thermoflexales bacterium]MDW8406644.1 hypothetical protein [Anaerolineae bacterium]